MSAPHISGAFVDVSEGGKKAAFAVMTALNEVAGRFGHAERLNFYARIMAAVSGQVYQQFGSAILQDLMAQLEAIRQADDAKKAQEVH
ncbi:hypothetical protein CO615_06675 [Lysobacteraceae bacterium NML75-0749]|nr:hypothetical protein CO615_06675 [Xanthomonadaceae bacterium NML75-0749]